MQEKPATFGGETLQEKCSLFWKNREIFDFFSFAKNTEGFDATKLQYQRFLHTTFRHANRQGSSFLTSYSNCLRLITVVKILKKIAKNYAFYLKNPKFLRFNPYPNSRH